MFVFCCEVQDEEKKYPHAHKKNNFLNRKSLRTFSLVRKGLTFQLSRKTQFRSQMENMDYIFFFHFQFVVFRWYMTVMLLMFTFFFIQNKEQEQC